MITSTMITVGLQNAREIGPTTSPDDDWPEMADFKVIALYTSSLISN